MISNSIGAYLFIRSCIFFLHLIAPFSIAYCTAILVFNPSAYRLPWPVEIWLVAEVVFYTSVYLPRKYFLQHEAIHPPNMPRHQRNELYRRCFGSIRDPEVYLSKWFKGSSSWEIKRENVKEWFGWAFLNTATIEPKDEEELDGYADQLEVLLGRKLEPGKGNATSLRLTLDKVKMLHRSLWWYFCVFVVDSIASINMLLHSFHFHRLPISRFPTVFPFRPLSIFSTHQTPARTITYWHRPHTSKTRLPVLFIHGIGIGLYPYVNFLAELNHVNEEDDLEGEVGIIAVEIMPISFRITNAALKKDEMCDEILKILKKHGWEKVVLVSHSYGSVVSTHLLQNPAASNLIGPMLFIDPVTFLLHLPDVAFNFTVRKPRQANEYQLYYFGSMDMGVSHTLARHFFWTENILWKDEIGDRRTTVVLGGRDIIVDTDAVGRYVSEGEKSVEAGVHWKHREWRGKGLDLLWFEELDHAQVFDAKRNRKLLVNVVRAYTLELPPDGKKCF